MTAGSRHRRHFTSHRALTGAARDDRADLDDVVVGEPLVAGHERVVADHEHRFGDDLEVPEQLRHRPGRRQLELATRIAQHDFHEGTRVLAGARLPPHAATLGRDA